MMNNKELQIKLGNATEKNIIKVLRSRGYWLYNFPKKTSGQPCDIIGLRGLPKSKKMSGWLIDGKHTRSEEVSFSFDRIEPNQISSMEYANNFANLLDITNCKTGFVIFFDRTKTLYWFPYDMFLYMRRFGKKSVNFNELRPFEEVLDEVLKDENNNK